MSAGASRRPLLLYALPPIFAAFAASWSIDHRVPGAPAAPASSRGERLPRGTAELVVRVVGPGEGAPSGVEVMLVREEWLAAHNPAAWRCCRDCGFDLFDTYCELAPDVVARLAQRRALDVEPARTAKTDDGEATFSGLPAGRYAVFGRPPQGALAVARDVVLGERDHVHVRLEAPWRASSAVRVTTTGDRPVKGATVLAFDPRLGLSTAAATDANGQAAFADLDADVAYHFVAFAPGYAPTERTNIYPGEELELELEEGAVLSGSVTHDGAPVANATLDLDDGLDGAKSDAQGRFRLADLSPGPHLLRAATADGLGAWQEVSLERGPATHVALELGHVRTLAVTVDDMDGKPAPRAEVRLLDGEGALVRREETDRHGVAVFELLPLVKYGLEARRPDLGAATGTVELGEGPGQAVVKLALVGSAGVRGRVVDGRGRPIAGVELSLDHLSASSDTGDDLVRGTTTGEDGRFAVPSLAIGPWELGAKKAGYLPAVRSFDMESSDKPVELELVLSEGGQIRGRVLDLDDRPVSGWTVRAYLPGTSEVEPTIADTTESGDGGAFAFAGLEPGTYELRASPPRPSVHHTLEGAETDPVRVQTGLGEVVVRTGGSGVLEGRVRFAGAPAPESFRVTVAGAGVRAFSGERGQLRFDDVPAGLAAVVVRAPGFVNGTAKVAVRAGERASVELVLPAAASLAGTVVDAATSAPIAGAAILATSSSEAAHDVVGRAISRSGGQFELRELPPGDTWLTVQVEGYGRPRFGPYRATSGAPGEPLTIALRRAVVTVSGEVSRAGKPIAGAGVTLLPAVGEPRTGTAGDDGAFRLESGAGLTGLVVTEPASDERPLSVYASSIRVPATGIDALLVDVASRGERAGKHKLTVETDAEVEGRLAVTVAPVREDASPSEVPISESHVLASGQRRTTFEGLAPGLYDVSVTALTEADTTDATWSKLRTSKLAARRVEVRAKGRETKVKFSSE